MFGIEEIFELLDNGHKVSVSRLLEPMSGIKGRNHPEGKSIIYMKNCDNESDYKETIIHELYHEYYPDASETEVEETSHLINLMYPEVADFVIDLMELPEYSLNENDKEV